MTKPSKRGAVVAFIKKTFSTEKGRQRKRLLIAFASAPTFIFVLSRFAPPAVDATFIYLPLKVCCIMLALIALHIESAWFRETFQTLRDKLQAIEQELSTSQRLYRNVLVLGLSLPLLAGLGAGPWMPTLICMFVAFCVFVASFDMLRWYRSISEHAIGKALLAIGFATASTLAYAIARQEIAGVTNVTPTNFTHTTLLMAIMTIPLLIVIAGGLAYMTSFLASLFILPLLLLARDAPAGLKAWLFAGVLKDNPIKHPLLTKIFQFFFYGTLGLLISKQGAPLMVRYESEVQKLLPGAIYHLDMYPGKECALQKGEKLAPLGDAKFLVGKQVSGGKIEFLPPVKCEDAPPHGAAQPQQ